MALRSALIELDRWQDSLLVSYAEFGRRPQENRSGGTDHGTANVHFFLGGAVRGGLAGVRPSLGDLDNGNPRHGVDYRRMYATAIEKWWGLPGAGVLGGRYLPLEVLRV